jgi:hypothetical protein
VQAEISLPMIDLYPHARQQFTSRSSGSPILIFHPWLLFAAVEVQDISHTRATRQLRYDIQALVAVNQTIIVIGSGCSLVLETIEGAIPF